MTVSDRKIRRPGRPRGATPEAVREALLQAARGLFSRRDFGAVSLREIAAQAGVNPAMVHYYFGGKEGLYVAMVEAAVQSVLIELAPLERDPAGGPALAGFLRAFVQLLAANPWLPNLVVREVWYGQAGFRRRFVQRFPQRLAEGLREMIAAEQRAGRLRRDLDPQLAGLSLISMAVLPFIAAPVMEQLWGLQPDSQFAARLADHSLRLFYEGARPCP